MLAEAKGRLDRLRRAMAAERIPLAILTDESTIAYFAGFWGYLGIEFGRPTFLVVRVDDEPVVVTPLMEQEMVAAMTWVTEIRPWEDAGPKGWRAVLGREIGASAGEIWVERDLAPAVFLNWLTDSYPGTPVRDISPLIARMRMIKSPLEIGIMRQAGAIAGAMMQAARDSLAEGAPEYECALAVLAAGTRAAAGFLTAAGLDRFVSPVIHNLQIMQSGRDTAMVHRRAGVKRLERGDPVYFCFCNLAEFRHYRLGFDRMFFIGEATEDAARVQETAIAAQQAALAAIHPGALAENVAAAANEVYRGNGFAPGYRTGRSIGVAYLEAPELKAGDRTVLQAGMTFAVDGGISAAGSTAGRIGDSIVVTESGFDYLTDYPRGLLIV